MPVRRLGCARLASGTREEARGARVLRGAPANHCFSLVGELLGAAGLRRAPAVPGEAPAPLCAAGAVGIQRAICALGGAGDAAHLVAADGATVRYRPTVGLVYDIDC